jgi:glycosyltransferase involved in cell wall biosynthesis
VEYSAVIPTKDRPDAAADTVRHLLAQTTLPRRIIVVDASTTPLALPDDVIGRAEAVGVEVELVPSRPSVHAQRNLGARRVDTPVVLFLDDDVTVPADYAEALLAEWSSRGLGNLGGIQGTPAEIPRQRALGRLVRRVAMLSYVDVSADAMRVRRSGKVRFAPLPDSAVEVPVLASGATAYRTDLVLRNLFDERFTGYTPGGDLEMSFRVASEAPLVQTPRVRWTHLWHPRERVSPRRWYVRGRCETYFRLRRLDRSALTLAAFGVSLAADGLVAVRDSVRERNAAHFGGFARGAFETIRMRPPAAGT